MTINGNKPRIRLNGENGLANFVVGEEGLMFGNSSCVSYSAIGADFCIYGACPFWSHVFLRCEYESTEEELAMMVVPVQKMMKMTTETPYDELEGPPCPLCGSTKTKNDFEYYGYFVCLDCRARFDPNK